MQCEARDGMHEHSFPECRSGPGAAALVQGCLVRHERQRYELGKPASALLQIAYGQQMPAPRAVVVDMPEHDGSGGAQTDVMGSFDDLEPLARVEFVRAKDLPDRVIENLGGGAGPTA